MRVNPLQMNLMQMNLLQMSLSGAILILVIAAIRAIAAERLPRKTYLALWGVALARLLVPVSFPLPFGGILSGFRWRVGRPWNAGVIAGGSSEINADAIGEGIGNGAVSAISGGADQTMPVASSHWITLTAWAVAAIWAVFAVCFALYFVIVWMRCGREFQTALSVHNEFVERWLQEHSLRRRIEIRRVSGLPTPLTYGIVHPVILMPGDTDWKDERQARYVLFHEYVHICHFDALWKGIAAAALCLHWFNPLVWVLFFSLQQDIELECDECVVRYFGWKRRKEYAEILLQMEGIRSGLVPFNSYFSKNTTEKRINSIMKFHKKGKLALFGAVILVVAGAAAVFAAPGTSGRSTDIGNILKGEGEFLYASENGPVSSKIEDVPGLFDPEDPYMKIWNFAQVDLDGDDEEEAVLFVFGAAGDTGGSLVLHQMGGKVYGYRMDYRQLENLKTDGTFSYSDPTGVKEAGICAITDFTQTGFESDKVTYWTAANPEAASDEGQGGFVVDHHSATEEEYHAAEEEQVRKTDAEWYDFTDENLADLFGK